MYVLPKDRNSSRRNAVKSKSNYNRSNKVLDENICYICNDKDKKTLCVICKKNICLSCSNSSICLYCNNDEKNKHIIETYLSSLDQSREVEIVERKNKIMYCCFI